MSTLQINLDGTLLFNNKSHYWDIVQGKLEIKNQNEVIEKWTIILLQDKFYILDAYDVHNPAMTDFGYVKAEEKSPEQ